MGLGLAFLTKRLSDEPTEKALLFKLDLSLVPYFSAIYFLFNLERSSYSHAYVSGMKDDIGFQGKQYNIMQMSFLVGFAISQTPFTTLLSIYRPRYIFFVANMMWAILTLMTFRLNTVHQFYVINFLEGVFTSGAFVGAHYMLGSWYKGVELGKRSAIFVSVGHIGSMVGGWVQAGLYAFFRSHQGSMPAWRWIFVVVFLVTVPFIFYGLMFIPDLPRHQNAWYLSDAQRKLAISRLEETKVESRRVPFTLDVVKHIMRSWQFWLMPWLFFLYGVSVQMLGNNVMPLWLQSRGYDVVQVNNIPTGIFICSFIAVLGYSHLSDALNSRWQVSVAIGMTFPIACSILLSQKAPDWLKIAAFYLLGTTLAPQAVWFTWCRDVTTHDYYLRAVTVGWMNAVSEAFISWWPIVFYPVTDAPYFTKGFTASLVFGSLILPTVALIVYLETRDRKTLEDESPHESFSPLLQSVGEPLLASEP